jgi:hypothetical protein
MIDLLIVGVERMTFRETNVLKKKPWYGSGYQQTILNLICSFYNGRLTFTCLPVSIQYQALPVIRHQYISAGG